MALDAALKVVGQAQGAIRGSLRITDHEGEIRVSAIEHRLMTPRDIATGQPTGRRQHGEFTITKELDPATPKLLQAWARNETLTTWVLCLFGVDATGRTLVAYTVELQDAAVSKVDLVLPSTFDPANAHVPAHERVAFVYRAISWTWAGGAITATDNWAETT